MELKKIEDPMTVAEADAWLHDLWVHIKKQHPHLAVRWWEIKGTGVSRYSTPTQQK